MSLIVSALRLVWNIKLDEMRDYEKLVSDEEYHADNAFIRRTPKLKQLVRTGPPRLKEANA